MNRLLWINAVLIAANLAGCIYLASLIPDVNKQRRESQLRTANVFARVAAVSSVVLLMELLVLALASWLRGYQ